MPGVHALLAALDEAGFRLAIGSSGPPENVNDVLQQLGNRERFDAVITGSDVTEGKPNPQVFLLAAERLGLEPAQCAVVEDAPLGIEAVRAAGMASVGLVSTGRTAEKLARADRVVRQLAELSPRAFEELIRSCGEGKR